MARESRRQERSTFYKTCFRMGSGLVGELCSWLHFCEGSKPGEQQVMTMTMWGRLIICFASTSILGLWTVESSVRRVVRAGDFLRSSSSSFFFFTSSWKGDKWYKSSALSTLVPGGVAADFYKSALSTFTLEPGGVAADFSPVSLVLVRPLATWQKFTIGIISQNTMLYIIHHLSPITMIIIFRFAWEVRRKNELFRGSFHQLHDNWQ